MKKTIYTNKGVRVIATGTLCVVLPSGQLLGQYDMAQINDAIEFADELADHMESSIAA